MSQREAAVREAAERFGTPCYLYFMQDVRERARALSREFGSVLDLSYAVKANPHTALLASLKNLIPHLDVSSGGELERALWAGWRASDISFTGPGKKRWELEYAVERGLNSIVVESLRELRLADEVAAEAGKQQRILLRIGPRTVPKGFGGAMSGRPSQFGIDEEALSSAVEAVADCRFLRLAGFHIYGGTQCLRIDALVENFKLMGSTFHLASELFRISPEVLVFGAGFGIPYYPDSEPLHLPALATEIRPVLETLRAQSFPDSRFLLEMGRFLVGEAGVFAMSVIDLKESRGHRIAVCDGGMHQHLGAAGHLGTVLPRNYRMFRVRREARQVPRDGQEPTRASDRPIDVVGPLCTSIDTLGRNVELEAIEVGDLLGIECSGAYGFSASPTAFISHPRPSEVFVQETEDGGLRLYEPADTPPAFPRFRNR